MHELDRPHAAMEQSCEADYKACLRPLALEAERPYVVEVHLLCCILAAGALGVKGLP